MSIISEALRKVSDKRSDVVKLRDEELKGVFIDDAVKASPKRIIAKPKKSTVRVWSSIATLFIVGFAVVAFFYTTGSNTNTAYAPPSYTPVIEPVAPAPAPSIIKAVTKPPVRPRQMPRLPDFVLNGIIQGKGESLAVIDNQILKKGDFYRGAQVINIGGDNVALSYHGQEIILRIK